MSNITLIEMAKKGDLKAVQKCIENCTDINYKPKRAKPLYHSMTALMAASWEGHFEIVKYLIDNGADINIQGDIGYIREMWTALMCASENGHLEIVKYLVENGADINIYDKVYDTALIEASRSQHLDVVKYLLENDAYIDVFTELSLFIDALENGDIELEKLILSRGFDIDVSIDIKDKNGCTALVRAIQSDNIERIKLLLENGADINARCIDGFTALMMTAKHRNIELVKYLIDNEADINAQDYDGKTALMCASEGIHYESDEGRIDVVKILIEAGADINIRDRKGNTALMFATDKGDHYIHDVVSFLIKSGADINNKDIYVQALEGLIYILQINGDNQWNEWLQKDIDYWMKDKEVEHHLSAYGGMGSFNDIMIGRMEGEIDYIFRFLKSFCSEFCKLYHSKKSDVTVLELQKKVLNDINKDSYHSLEKLNQLITQGLKNGTVLEVIKSGAIINDNGPVAKSNEYTELIKYFIDNAPKINIEDQDSRIALIRASQGGGINMVEYYLRDPEYNDINIKSKEGYTALMVASANGHLEVVKFLIDNGADINIEANNGKTALKYARDYGYIEIAKLLKKARAGK